MNSMYEIISAKRLSNGAGGSDIYTKSGTIRKDCKVTQYIDATAEEMKNHLKAANYQITGKPYVFTHIEGRDLFGNRCIIRQEVRGMICSPVKLAELLGL